MLHQDFLMRVIRNLGAAFGRLIKMRGEAPEQAKLEIEELLAEHLGTRRELLFAQPLSVLERLEPEVAAFFGKHFALHSEISRELGDLVDARESMLWGIHAFARAMEGSENETTKDAERELTAFLRGEVVGELASVEEARFGYEALFLFGERHERLPEAEDALFAALELGAGEELRRRGREFFEGVAGESESYYLEHGLSEDEVRAIVDELRDR